MTRNRCCLLLGLLSAHALSARSVQAAPGGPFEPSPPDADAVDEPVPREPHLAGDPCDISPFSSVVSERCSTPRRGTVSGGYLALDVGVVGLSPRAAQRVGVAESGPLWNLRLGLEFADVLVLGLVHRM